MAALLFIDAASYHEVCKIPCIYLRRDSRLDNGWHISHLCPYRHKCSTFFLHMQCYSSRFQCNKGSLLKILMNNKGWQIPGALPFPPCLRKGVFTYIFHCNLLCHCKYNGRHFISINVLVAVGKTSTMSLKQPYQTTVSIEWLPCLSLMQQVNMKYAKNMQLLGEGQ